jgi:uncharacterized protein
MQPAEAPPTDRSAVRRHPERARYDREQIDAVLDEGLVAHVGVAIDGQAYVIPMAYGRDGDRLILHGSVASRLLRSLGGGVPVCVTVTLLDGLVLARSTFHHSMNYRSVVVLGTARRIDDAAEAAAALDALVEHVVPGRTDETRPPSDPELRRTAVLELLLDEASMKERSGGALDEPDDVDLPVWAGVIPIGVAAGAPVPNGDLRDGVALPASVGRWARPAVRYPGPR